MKRGRKVGPRGALVAAVAVGALAVAGGAAWASGIASIVGADGTINGCYQTANGQLRVVSTGETCGPSELAISWNQKGSAGERGPQGERGPAGERGPQGERGPEGPAGAAGANGADGADGADGTSVTGEQVAPGDSSCANGGAKLTAANGVVYACNGAKGETGPPGPAGPAGQGTAVAYSHTKLAVGTSAVVLSDPAYGALRATCVVNGAADMTLVAPSALPSGDTVLAYRVTDGLSLGPLRAPGAESSRTALVGVKWILARTHAATATDPQVRVDMLEANVVVSGEPGFGTGACWVTAGTMNRST